MGSRRNKYLLLNFTNAYGKTMTKTEKQKIDNFNAANRNEGKTKDDKQIAERQAIAQKAGTTDYKNIIRQHADKIGSILGVKQR